jgi:hypothetical protein
MMDIKEIGSKIHIIFAISRAIAYRDLEILINHTMVQKIYFIGGLFVLPEIELIQFFLPDWNVKSEILDESFLPFKIVRTEESLRKPCIRFKEPLGIKFLISGTDFLGNAREIELWCLNQNVIGYHTALLKSEIIPDLVLLPAECTEKKSMDFNDSDSSIFVHQDHHKESKYINFSSDVFFSWMHFTSVLRKRTVDPVNLEKKFWVRKDIWEIWELQRS